MPPDPSPPVTLEVSESPPRVEVGTRRRGNWTVRRGSRWRRWVAIASGLIAACLVVALAWSEFYPKALALADAAYRRNDLETTLRIAKAHLASRPFSRYAATAPCAC